MAARALPAADLAPPQPRPKTTAAVARRLIGAALGNANGLRDKVCRLLPDADFPYAGHPGARVGRQGACFVGVHACMHQLHSLHLHLCMHVPAATCVIKIQCHTG